MFSRISGLFAEHKLARRPFRSLSSLALAQYWSPFSLRSSKIKLMLLEARFSVISSVVRDWREELVFACSKKVNTTLSFQAKAEAIKWHYP